MKWMVPTPESSDRITVFLADDNVIVREGVRALLAMEPDIEIVGTAGDYDELIAGAEAANPQVLVTDIRMPPSFTTEGIDAAKRSESGSSTPQPEWSSCRSTSRRTTRSICSPMA